MRVCSSLLLSLSASVSRHSSRAATLFTCTVFGYAHALHRCEHCHMSMHCLVLLSLLMCGRSYRYYVFSPVHTSSCMSTHPHGKSQALNSAVTPMRAYLLSSLCMHISHASVPARGRWVRCVKVEVLEEGARLEGGGGAACVQGKQVLAQGGGVQPVDVFSKRRHLKICERRYASMDELQVCVVLPAVLFVNLRWRIIKFVLPHSTSPLNTTLKRLW